MHIPLRHVTPAGAALMVSATVLAATPVTPVTPSAPPAPVVAHAVELAALPTWLQWIDNGSAAIGAQIAAVAAGVQNELAHPLPIVPIIGRNLIKNLTDLSTAAGTAAQTLSIVPITAALVSIGTTTAARAAGAAGAIVGNLGPITGAVIAVPVAITGALIAAGFGVAGAAISLNPLNVIGALGDGAVNVETAAFNAAAGVATAVGIMRQGVRTAVAFPLPAAAAHATPAASAVTARPASQPGAVRSEHALRPVRSPGLASRPGRHSG